MIWAVVCLSVAAIQLGPQFISQPFSVLFSDSILLDIEEVEVWTLHSWVSMYQNTPELLQAWTLTTPQGTLTLCKLYTGDFQACIGGTCATSIASGEQFKWEFISVLANGSQFKLCSSQWDPRSLSCVSLMSLALVLESTSTITVSAEVELFELQLKTEYLSDLSAVLNSYSCHAVCLGCFGPSFTSCNEFFALVDLQSTKVTPPQLTFTRGDRVFRGRTYDNISEYAITGWFMMTSYSGTWVEVLRFSNTLTNLCSNTARSREPQLQYNSAGYFFRVDTERANRPCGVYNDFPNNSFGAPTPPTGIWIYTALLIQATQSFNLAVFSSATPYTQPIIQASTLYKWSTSGTNRIILGTVEFNYVSNFKFKDMRVYTDLTTGVQPETPFGQMKLYCQSNCLTCSDVEVCASCVAGFYVNSSGVCIACNVNCLTCNIQGCSSCPTARTLIGGACVMSQCSAGHYLDGGVCKACSTTCLTCSGAGANACSICAGSLFLTKEGNCSTTCPEGTLGENSQCKSCPTDCKSCINSNECTACLDTFYQLKTSSTVLCLQECPIGYFVEQRACRLCDASCKACTGPTKADCLECARDYFLIGVECSQCPAGTRYDSDNCFACEASCKTCSTSEVCDSCPQGKMLSNQGLCISISCQPGTYLGTTGCLECPALCETCASEDLCFDCAQGSRKVNELCQCKSVYVQEDICRVPFKLTSEEGSVLLLTFNAPLKPGLTAEEIVLETELSVVHSLRQTDVTSSYYVYVQFNPTPTASVTLGVAVKSNLTDVNAVSISKETVQVELSFSQTKKSTPAQSASQITSSALVGGALLFGMLIGNPHSLFLLLNMLQFASLIPLMHFNISEELSSLLIGNNPFDVIPNMSSLVLKPDWFPEAYYKAKNYGFNSAGFLNNIGQELSVLVSLLLVLIGLYIGSKLECSCSFQRHCSKKYLALKAALIPGYLKGIFQEVLVAAMIQLKSQDYHDWLNIISCCCAWAVVVLSCVGSLLLAYSALRGKLNSFFLGSSALDRAREPAFYVHRLVCVLVITLSSNSLLQGLFCFVLSLLVIFRQKFLLVFAGMLHLHFNWSFLLLEASDWVSLVVLLVYDYQPSIESSLKMINIFHSIIYALLALSLVTSLYQLIVYCRKPRRSRIEV